MAKIIEQMGGNNFDLKTQASQPANSQLIITNLRYASQASLNKYLQNYSNGFYELFQQAITENNRKAPILFIASEIENRFHITQLSKNPTASIAPLSNRHGISLASKMIGERTLTPETAAKLLITQPNLFKKPTPYLINIVNNLQATFFSPEMLNLLKEKPASAYPNPKIRTKVTQLTQTTQ